MPRFIICRASAGSGKTYTLVRQYIETAISSPSQLEERFRQILAITFTNKAANGMKERIMTKLHDIVVGKASAQDIVAEMATHLQVSETEVVRRCTVLQSAILHNYSDFSVCTIDSFVHRLVRTFAHDLNLPMNFNVQIDQQEILKNVVDQLLSLAGQSKEKPLTEILCAFTESRMEDSKGYKVEHTISELSKEIFKEETPEYISRLDNIDISEYKGIYTYLVDENRRYEKQIQSAAADFVAACDSHGLNVDSFPNKKSGVFPFFLSVSKGDFSKLNNTHKRVDEAYSDGRLYAKSTPADLIPALEAVMPAYRAAYEAFDQGLAAYNTRSLLLTNLYGLALLGKINEMMNKYYTENEIVHISEFNKRIAKQVADEPAPFIYERIGSRYHNYLIDEFQDTSRLQWLNFLPLLDEAMTYSFSSDTAQPGEQSLVVGDGKQAIYRFRQGDVRQFIRLPEVDSDQHGQSLSRNARTDRLDRNFRTLSNIVNFNNRFFTSLVSGHYAANAELQKLYIGSLLNGRPDLEQRSVKEGGYVQLSFTGKDDIFSGILAAIRHQVDDLHYNYGDIYILARDNDTLVRISDYLIANSVDRPIPIVSSESFILTGSDVVLLLQSALEYLYDTSNAVAAVQVIQLAVRCGCLSTPANLQSVEWQLRDAEFNLNRLLSIYGIDFNAAYLRSLSLYDCCEALLRIFHLEGKDTAYVSTFLGAVASYMQHSRADLAGLIEWLGERMGKLSSSTSPDLDAVQLMTIHKAKGLEAKIVILAMPYKRVRNTKIWAEVPDSKGMKLPVAFVNLQSNRTAFDALFAQERAMGEMDRVNILYVAMTRPEEKLLLFCEDVNNSDSHIPLLHSFAKNDAACRPLGEGLYAIGDDFPNSHQDSEEEDKNSTFTIHNSVFAPWEKRVSIAVQNESVLSDLQAGALLEDDSRRYGITVHDLLTHINTPDDVRPVVESYCREHRIADADAQSILARISRMMEKEENRRYFDPACQVYCEASIVVDGQVRRPDRIVCDGNQTWVVDFKTGAYSDESHRHYQRQVAEYAAALSLMGFPNVQPVILYL